jgi:Uma2 family endonuclease
MSALAERTTYTPEDLLAMADGERFELVGGELVEKEMGLLSSIVSGKLYRLLGDFVELHGLGWTPNSECGYRCFPWDDRMVRRPDASFIAGARLKAEDLDVGYVGIAPDLAVEVVSSNDLFKEVVEKADEYLRAGVRLIWVVEPFSRMVYVYRTDGTISLLRAGQELDGEEVLPGFRCAVASLFPPTSTPSV